MDGFAGWHEVLYRSEATWIRLVVVAPSDGNAASLPLARAWLWPWAVTVAGIVSHPVILVTLIALLIGGALMYCTRRHRPKQDKGVFWPRGTAIPGGKR
jgi:hypothetical protein